MVDLVVTALTHSNRGLGRLLVQMLLQYVASMPTVGVRAPIHPSIHPSIHPPINPFMPVTFAGASREGRSRSGGRGRQGLLERAAF